MKYNLFVLVVLVICSCTPSSLKDTHGKSDLDGKFLISAEKVAWRAAAKTKATDSLAVPTDSSTVAFDSLIVTGDVPWEEGEQILILSSDQSFAGCADTTIQVNRWIDEAGKEHIDTTSFGIGHHRPYETIVCTVRRTDGLKCVLTTETPLAEGTYRAIYPFSNESDTTDGSWYDMKHLSFLYNNKVTLEYNNKDVVVSNPVTYHEGDSLSFVLKHLTSLVDIDVCLPDQVDNVKKCIFLTSKFGVLPGKVDYWLDKKINTPDDYGRDWINFTALYVKDSELQGNGLTFHTRTGILPLPLQGIPMIIHVFFENGVHYVSKPFEMSSLSPGIEYSFVVTEFEKTEEPLKWGSSWSFGEPITYGDSDLPFRYN